MQIYVDADACPVKDVIIEEAGTHEKNVILVSSISHFSLKELPSFVRTVYVDAGAEAADYKLMQLLKAGDVLVTQDHGLASLALAKQVRVLNQKGFEYSGKNIEKLLEQRYYSAMQRKSGKRTKGPSPFTSKDKDAFRHLIRSVLEQGLSLLDEKQAPESF